MENNLFVNKEDPILSAIEEIDNAVELGAKGILKDTELQEVETRSRERVEGGMVKDSIMWREYDLENRSTTYWSKVTRTGYAAPEDVKGRLQRYRKYATRIMNERGNEPQKKQYFIDKGQVASGRKLLRDILVEATTEIFIQDNYVTDNKGQDLELLYLLQPYLEEIPSLQIRILTINVSNAFKSDFALFNQQYTNRLQLKLHNNAHDRYVIIDSKDVYHMGASLKDLGKKATQVNLVTEDTEKQKVITACNDWFNNGTAI